MFDSTKPQTSSGPKEVLRGGDTKYQGKKNKHSAGGECTWSLYEVLKAHNHYDANGGGIASYATSRAREDILKQGFKILHECGFKIRNVRNFSNTHMHAIAAHWENKKLAASTLQLRFSVFRTFCSWIGKKGMVGDATQYLKNPEIAKRSYVAKEDKGWVAKGVEIMAKIEEVFAKNPFVGIQLLLQWAFGLRAREAWQYHPKDVSLLASVANIEYGAKNGRERDVPVMNPWQQKVIETAKRYANNSTGSMIPSRYKRNQWHDHFYRVCRSCGISRKNGVVPHGLRHERANDLYYQLTGMNSPVRGGAEQVEKHLLAIDTAARRIVAEYMGHCREQSTGAYCGKKPRVKKEAT